MLCIAIFVQLYDTPIDPVLLLLGLLPLLAIRRDVIRL